MAAAASAAVRATAAATAAAASAAVRAAAIGGGGGGGLGGGKRHEIVTRAPACPTGVQWVPSSTETETSRTIGLSQSDGSTLPRASAVCADSHRIRVELA